MDIYTCTVCEKTFERSSYSCNAKENDMLLPHQKCCHYGDTEITEDMMNDAKDAAFADFENELLGDDVGILGGMDFGDK